MAVYDILPNTNLTVSDIRDTLNANGGTTDNEFSSLFKAAANHNKWSKEKPTKYYKLLFAKGNEEPKQWQADNGLCGFVKSSVVFTDRDSLVESHKSGDIYIYELPTGGESYPFRIGDFRGYSTKAKSPILNFEREGEIVANNSSSSMSFNILGNSDIDEDSNLLISDILPDGSTSLEDYYFAVVVTDNSGDCKALCKSSSKIGTSKGFSRSATLTYSQLGLAGSYIAYPCFVNSLGDEYVACPMPSISFKIAASADDFMVGWMDNTGYCYRGAKFTFGAQLAYNNQFGGAKVRIYVIVVNQNFQETEVGSYDEITLPEVTTDRGYYDFMTTKVVSYNAGDRFRLRVYYGSQFLNTDDIELGEPTAEEPIIISNEED
jgi:hypothetical protein